MMPSVTELLNEKLDALLGADAGGSTTPADFHEKYFSIDTWKPDGSQYHGVDVRFDTTNKLTIIYSPRWEAHAMFDSHPEIYTALEEHVKRVYRGLTEEQRKYSFTVGNCKIYITIDGRWRPGTISEIYIKGTTYKNINIPIISKEKQK
jgi:hypothetical protein